MALLPFGFMVLLLSCSKLSSGSEPQRSITEVVGKIIINGENGHLETRKNIIESHASPMEALNNLRKRSIDYSRRNQISYYDRPYYYTDFRPAPQEQEFPPYPYYTPWQPPPYQLQRPYYIPVWGSPGRAPVYFPPQPLFPSYGFPPDNPPNGYLPPTNTNMGNVPNINQPPPCNNDTQVANNVTCNRFDGPVWGTATTVTPPGSPEAEITVRPTRRPGQSATTHPPLVHNPIDVEAPSESVTTRRPTIMTTARPSANNPANSETGSVPGPSRCVWAIVNCCSVASNKVNTRCFEQLGCSGAFWGDSPCDSDFARAATNLVLKYYNP